MHITIKTAQQTCWVLCSATWGTLQIIHSKSTVLFLQASKDTRKWSASGDWEGGSATTLNLQYLKYWRLWNEGIQDTKGKNIINESRTASCTTTWAAWRVWNVVQAQGEPQVSFGSKENPCPFIWLYFGFGQNLPGNIHVSELCVGPKF